MSATLKTVLAPLPATKRGSNVLPGADPKGNTILYSCGSVIVVRDIKEPSKASLFTGHVAEATVAQYAPSGFYAASGDAMGKVKIWDTTQAELAVKYEYQPLSGAIKDIAWSVDSKRIVVGGEGRDKFASVFLWDSGSSVGDISAHSKAVNSVDMKPSRPYSLATASEDNTSAFFQGPPFNFQHSNKDHTRFVNCVRYAPDGSVYATASSDGQVFLYDGKTGEKTGALGSPAHGGSVMGLAWSPNSAQLLTASADKTAKLWSVKDMTLVSTFAFGDTVDDQQLGCLWVGTDMLTVSLSGYLNYLDPDSPEKAHMVVQGHNKAITAMAIAPDCSKFYSADHSGRIVSWDAVLNVGTTVRGTGHTNQVNSLVVASDTLWSAGMDDIIMATPTETVAYVDESKTAVAGCPHGIAVEGPTLVVATAKGVEVYRDGKQVAAVAVGWSPLCVALNKDADQVAVGAKDSKVHIFTLTVDSLTEASVLDAKGHVMCASYSPDGQYLAVGDQGRNVLVWSIPEYERVISEWVFHSATVACLAWSPSSHYLATGGIDTNIFVWSIKVPAKRIQLRSAHVGSVNCVGWLAEDTVVSAGQDAAIKIWTIAHH